MIDLAGETPAKATWQSRSRQRDRWVFALGSMPLSMLKPLPTTVPWRGVHSCCFSLQCIKPPMALSRVSPLNVATPPTVATVTFPLSFPPGPALFWIARVTFCGVPVIMVPEPSFRAPDRSGVAHVRVPAARPPGVRCKVPIDVGLTSEQEYFATLCPPSECRNQNRDPSLCP